MQITSKLYKYRLRSSARWFNFSRRLMEESDCYCMKCKKYFPNKKYLTVHHKYYIEDRDPWDYPDEACDVLCLKCHKLIDHSNIPRKRNPFKIELSSKIFIATDNIFFKKYYETTDMPYNEFFGIVYYGTIINCGYTTQYDNDNIYSDKNNGRFDFELIVRELENSDNSYRMFRKKQRPIKYINGKIAERSCLKIEDYI